MVKRVIFISSCPSLFIKIFLDYSKSTNYSWYHRHLNVLQCFTIIISLLVSSSHQITLAAFHWCDIASPLVSRTFSVFWPILTMLDCLNSSSSFQLFQFSFQSFGDCSQCTTYIITGASGASGRGISEYNLDRARVEWVRFVTPTRRRCTSNYYITQCTGSSISWR